MFLLNKRVTVFVGLILAVMLVMSAYAQDLKAVKSRMIERKPAIESLKKASLIGEGSDGYLHVRNATGDSQKTVSAENADRKIVYEAIAGKEGVSASKVAKRRALQLAQMASTGDWLMKEDGTWYQK